MRLLDDLRQDLRYAVRGMMRRPGFTAAAAVTLALGIGAAAAIFSAFDETLWRPLPVGNPDRLVAIFGYNAKTSRYLSCSYADFLDFRAQAKSLSDLAAYFRYAVNLTAREHAERVAIEVVSTNYFDVLRLPPLAGRGFAANDDDQPVVMIGEHLWRSHFAADSGVLGQTIRLEDHPFTVVGIVPARFHGVDLNWGDTPEIWMPIGVIPSLVPSFRQMDILYKGRFMLMVGRRKPGVPVERVAAEMRVLAAKAPPADPETDRDITAVVFPASRAKFWPAYRGRVLGWFGVFGGGAVLLLLLACANVSSLLVERALGRRREMAVRLSIGGSRGRLARQLLTEGALLAVPSFLLSVAVAEGLERLLLRFPAAFGINLNLEFGLEYRVLLPMAAVSLGAAMLFSLAPVLQASRPEMATWLRSAGSASSSARSPWMRHALVAAQVAFSTMLLVGGGLFGRSLLKAYAIDPGFRPGHLLVLSFSPPSEFVPRLASLQQPLLRAAAAQPGVASATLAMEAPLSGIHVFSPVSAAGASSAPITADYNLGGPDYARTLGIPLVAGRDFSPRDDLHASKVALVSEALARRLFGNANPIGRRILVRDRAEAEVVGVLRDARATSLWQAPEPCLYLAALQRPQPASHLLLRTLGAPGDVAAALRRQWDTLAPGAPLDRVRTGQELVDGALEPQRLAAGLLAAFGLSAIVLASVGLYSVMAYAVARRTREIGIRLAIGAQPSAVVRQTMASALRLAAAGVAAGAAGSAAVMRLAAAELHGVSPHDWVTFAVVALLLIAVALAAALAPALRAARIDPLRALNWE